MRVLVFFQLSEAKGEVYDVSGCSISNHRSGCDGRRVSPDVVRQPDQALQGYSLTPDEVEALRNLKQEDLEDFSTKLDSRITSERGGIVAPGTVSP